MGRFSAAFFDGRAGVSTLARALPNIAGVCQGALARQDQSLRSSFCCGLGLTGTALAEAIAVAVHLEDADMMCQPVEQRAGQALGAEGLGPLVEGQIAGNQRGAAFIAFAIRTRYRGNSFTVTDSSGFMHTEWIGWYLNYRFSKPPPSATRPPLHR